MPKYYPIEIRMNSLSVGYGITPKELGNNWRGLLLKNTIEYNVMNYLKLFYPIRS